MIPLVVRQHLAALGVGDAGIGSVECEIGKAMTMTRDELRQAVEVKNDAIRYLRIQQAVYLAALDYRFSARKPEEEDSDDVVP